MKKIKVVFVSPFTTGGGACRNMFSIIGQLGSNYDKQLIVTGTDTLPAEYQGLIDTISLGYPSVTGAFKSLAKQLKKQKPDYIFCPTLNTGLVCAFIVKLFKLNCKTITRCPVPPSEIHHQSIKTRLLRKALKIGGKMIDLVIAQTEFMRFDLINYYGFSDKKVKTIRNIVDFKHIESQAQSGLAIELKSKNCNIVAIGALYSVKGFDLLIEAVAPIIKNINNVHLYIIGEERYEVGYRKFLQDKIDSFGLAENIHLLGSRSNPFPYFKAADLFVLSSRKEGYPNVVLEALVLKTPVVTTNVVDFHDVIFDGVNGFIVEKDSIESLRAGIQKALDNLPNFSSANCALQNFDFKTLFS